MNQYDRSGVLGCKLVDGVLVVLSSNQSNIVTFVHQMGDVCVSFWLSFMFVYKYFSIFKSKLWHHDFSLVWGAAV